MTRIIAGTAGGRRLFTPPGKATRPTSDRVREALFSILAARDAVAGSRVLDLFAGSGALGLEAVSRGARHAVLVDSSRTAAGVARRNADLIDPDRVAVVTLPVERYLARGPVGSTGAPEGMDLVLVDPPYDLSEPVLGSLLAALTSGGWLAPSAVIVVERSARSPRPDWPAELIAEPARTYGETALWLAARPG